MNKPRSEILSVTRFFLVTAVIFLFGSMSAHAKGPVPDQVNRSQFHPGYYALVQSHDAIPSDVLQSDDFVGIKIKYTWRDLETGFGQYDFSEIEADLALLKASNKRLWIQIEYVEWAKGNEPKTPKYMWNNSKYGGDSRYYGNYERSAQSGGWYPLFWNTEVRKRLVQLVMAIGVRFQREAYVEGFSIPETAADRGEGFDCGAYQETLKQMAVAAKAAFGDKAVLQMINFACFDLAEHAAWLERQGVGLGTPDIYDFKTNLTGVVYPLMLKHGRSVPVGPDVQWANYDRNDLSVAEIRDFAIKRTDPAYMFWRNREPYFSNEVLPAIWRRKLPTADNFYGSSENVAPPKSPSLQ